jgi:SNF family Na+-dependent transporter
VSTRELIALLSGLAVVIALSYVFAIEPKTWGSFLLVIPMLLVAVAVAWIFDRREERE